MRLPNVLRTVVSGPKARLVDKESQHDLDLVYLTDRVILMGYPASGVESLYRNKMTDVSSFLEGKHRDHYRVFNFCPQSENSYPPTSFNKRISRYPFPDHHAPPLPLLHLATDEMKVYLEAHLENVVVIHCKAGKGRTGTVACCLIERLGGVEKVKTDHGTTRGNPLVLSTDKEEEDASEGGIASRSPTTHSEDPIVSTVDPREPASGSTEEPSLARSKSTKSKNKKPLKVQPHPASQILDFHTQRRMAHPSVGNPGVSIPSQRRFIHYYLSSVQHLQSTSSGTRSIYPACSGEKPMLKLVDVIVQHACPPVKEFATTPQLQGEVSRYLDSFVNDLDGIVQLSIKEGGFPAVIEGAGGLGIGMSGLGTDEIGGEGLVGDKAHKGGSGMVRSLADLKEAFAETGEMDWDDYGERSKTLALYTHHLTPAQPVVVDPERELKIQVWVGPGAKSTSGLLNRGVKAGLTNVALGQNVSSLGWLWLIPAFHLSLPTQSASTSSGSSTEPTGGLHSTFDRKPMLPHLPPPSQIPTVTHSTHTLTFDRSLVDFRSKSLRSVKLVFEEIPSEETKGSKGKGRELVPEEDSRGVAFDGGEEGAVGGKD